MRRWGKIALVIILAGLTVAGGMAFPEVKDAAAQGSHHGYTYTQRVCQEYGQQPRWYNVRDPISGSDWRSDGGWAIVLERGSGITYTFTATGLAAGAIPNIELAAPRRERRRIAERSSGVTGFITYQANGAPSGWVVIDRNNDGEIDIAGDRTAGVGSNNWEFRQYTSEVYGSRYIRWANMQWCRQ